MSQSKYQRNNDFSTSKTGVKPSSLDMFFKILSIGEFGEGNKN